MINNINVLSTVLSFKDNYLSLHHQAVCTYSSRIAIALNLPEQAIEIVRYAALLHDTGKIGIPNNILFKKGPLTLAEWEIIKLHPVTGAELLSNNYLLGSDIINAVRFHHEHWDGSGYPDGLGGEGIPLTARIIAVADAYDAMVTDRPYRKALAKEEAIKEVIKCSGKQFDPIVTEVFSYLSVHINKITI